MITYIPAGEIEIEVTLGYTVLGFFINNCPVLG
jgi:hypothetical protein